MLARNTLLFASAALVAMAVLSVLFVAASFTEEEALQPEQRKPVFTSRLRSQQNRAKVAALKAAGKTKRWIVRRNPEDKTSAVVAGGAFAGAITNPPFVQPHRMIIMISNWCTSQFMYDSWGSDMSQGAYEVAPAPVIASQSSESFVAIHDPASLNISGTALYYFDSATTSGVMEIAFMAVKDGYELSVSYETAEHIALVGSVPLGSNALYNLQLGKEPYSGPSVC